MMRAIRAAIAANPGDALAGAAIMLGCVALAGAWLVLGHGLGLDIGPGLGGAP